MLCGGRDKRIAVKPRNPHVAELGRHIFSLATYERLCAAAHSQPLGSCSCFVAERVIG
jgi:hypothetical protein